MNEEITIKERQSVDISVSLVLSKFKVALSKLERVVSSRSTLPILNNILIKAHKGGVELMATDLEIGVKFNIGGKVEQEGVITIPGRTLINLINNIHSDTVTLTTKNNIVSVVAGETKANLNGVPADDFPVIPEVEGGKSVNLPAGLFKEWLNQVDFAASTEESRPVLTGVYLSSDGNKLTLAATDSYRLSEMVVNEN
jgi:DNA polymerase III subunit beta